MRRGTASRSGSTLIDSVFTNLRSGRRLGVAGLRYQPVRCHRKSELLTYPPKPWKIAGIWGLGCEPKPVRFFKSEDFADAGWSLFYRVLRSQGGVPKERESGPKSAERGEPKPVRF